MVFTSVGPFVARSRTIKTAVYRRPCVRWLLSIKLGRGLLATDVQAELPTSVLLINMLSKNLAAEDLVLNARSPKLSWFLKQMVALVHIQLQKALRIGALPTWLPALIELTLWKEITVMLQCCIFFKGKLSLLFNLLSESAEVVSKVVERELGELNPRQVYITRVHFIVA
jgi:hypothetical protein